MYDMWEFFWGVVFDYIFNFFISFGYFEEEIEDLQILKNVVYSLKLEGIFVFDFFNVYYVW